MVNDPDYMNRIKIDKENWANEFDFDGSTLKEWRGEVDRLKEVRLEEGKQASLAKIVVFDVCLQTDSRITGIDASTSIRTVKIGTIAEEKTRSEKANSRKYSSTGIKSNRDLAIDKTDFIGNQTDQKNMPPRMTNQTLNLKDSQFTVIDLTNKPNQPAKRDNDMSMARQLAANTDTVEDLESKFESLTKDQLQRLCFDLSENMDNVKRRAQ